MTRPCINCCTRGITPLIQIRGMWQNEPERMLPGHDGASTWCTTKRGQSIVMIK